MRGDHTLFTTAQGIERLWEVSTTLLESPPRRFVSTIRDRGGRIQSINSSLLRPGGYPSSESGELRTRSLVDPVNLSVCRPWLSAGGASDPFLPARRLNRKAARPPADVPPETSRVAVPMHRGHMRNSSTNSSVLVTSLRHLRAADRRSAIGYRNHRRGSMPHRTRAGFSVPRI
jgi:hypothetical protein